MGSDLAPNPPMATSTMLLIGAAVAVGAWVLLRSKPSTAAPAVTGHRAIKGPPTGDGVSYEIKPSGPVTLVDGKPLWPNLDVPRAQKFATLNQKVWAWRRLALPPDAKPTTDKYSKGLYAIPSWARKDPATFVISGGQPSGKVNLATEGTGVLVDEFGRPVEGAHYGSGGGAFDVVTNLTKNPLFMAAVTTAVVVFGGPAGMAVLGAYTVYQNRGREFTFKNAALIAARTYAVSQCGEVCGTAFDFGVGVASGDSVDEAAENALLSKLTPEQRAYYEKGKKDAKDLGITG